MQTLRRIGVGSAFKMGFALNALVMIVVGFFIIFLPTVFGSLLFMRELSDLGGMGLIGGIIGWALMIVFGGLAGGVGAAIYAFLYNMAAGWMGGIEIEIS